MFDFKFCEEYEESAQRDRKKALPRITYEFALNMLSFYLLYRIPGPF